jgi:hypothetical protein
MFSLKCFDSIHETSEHHCEILDIPAIPANVPPFASMHLSKRNLKFGNIFAFIDVKVCRI